ncbi:hypothetical protein C2G38_2165243 [Gigaspora rosea]|uniref:Uncharacterized protein n=1 Tax=Gigaspora rosea TaxID=44941 RepID=A0A397W0A9_9GLOM|nr:hypothetical protein C2G38_2165243 [Gigaspora rosea]
MPKNFIAIVEKTENLVIPIKLGAIFGSLTWSEFVNNDTYKHEFDSKSNVIVQQVIDDKKVCQLELYSFTIAAWKLYYILDCLQINGKLLQLREGFQYFDEHSRRRPCHLN